MKTTTSRNISIQLFQGEFDKNEVLDLITRMIHLKIKFHEEKISETDSEEGIKMRESRIKQLQRDLYELRSELDYREGRLRLSSTIDIE